MRDGDRATYESFLNECRKGQSFLLVCDNCGEIVLDKLMLEQLICVSAICLRAGSMCQKYLKLPKTYKVQPEDKARSGTSS